jgi:hypothetical protein
LNFRNNSAGKPVLLGIACVISLAMLLGGATSAGPASGIGSALPEPSGPTGDASHAFNRYVQLTEERIGKELRPGGAFLMVDSLPPGARDSAYSTLRNGELRIEHLETRDNGRAIECPGGMIHHWVGIMFVPGVTLEKALHLVEDYDHHAEVYAPQVVRANVISRAGGDFHVFMRLRQKRIITVVLDTEHDAHYDRIDAQREASSSVSTRVQQVEDAGSPGERVLPEGRDDGFLWRINTYWRFLERDGGVYVQSESVSLTRNIPTGLGWLIGPFMESIPRELLQATLDNTRKGLTHPTARALATNRE